MRRQQGQERNIAIAALPYATAGCSGPTSDAVPRSRPAGQPLRAFVEGLIHARSPDRPPWRLLPAVLALAFAARAAIALTGDFVLHADEIMQYLEPAHRLVFGNGVIYWEYFYGARSWLVPGAVAGMLKLFDAVGLGQPWWYVDGVKLLFCALSLTVPAGMYCFARRSFGEMAARLALLAGAFWYELVVFAHKPLTELVATAPLVGLLALCVRPEPDRPRVVWHAAALAVLTGAIRMQYAPVALLLLSIVFLRTRRKLLLVLAAAAMFSAVGFFDALTWDGGLFHSYVTNLRYNLIVGGGLSGGGPAYQIPWWFLLAGGGLGVLCLVAGLRSPRRYGLLLALVALVFVIHSLPEHKEYRFVFATIPLWLLIGSDLAARVAAWTSALLPARPRASYWTLGALGALCAVFSVAGLLRALPAQVRAYQDWSYEAGTYGFVGGRDPAFATFRYLARAPGVEAVWQADRPYASTPGYYYLHRTIPLYDAATGSHNIRDLATLSASVSHLVSADPNLSVPGYSLEREFDGIRVLRRDATEPPVRRWREYTPVIVFDVVWRAMQGIDVDAPAPSPNFGIGFADRTDRGNL